MTELDKMRAMEDAGYSYPEPWHKYEKCVKFIKEINNGVNPSQSVGDGIKMLLHYEKEAEKLLKEIGKIK